MDERGQFTFYRSFWEAIKGLPKKDKLPILEAIISYALDGTVTIKLTKSQLHSFLCIKPEVDKERRLAVEGRRSAEYKAWRSAVFSRDNYTCQSCGSRGCKLNAHHIKLYAYHPELRLDLDNGVTLCVLCHKFAHRKKMGGRI